MKSETENRKVRGVKLTLILLYLIFVLINISVNRLVKALGLPLYVDNIGTLLGAVLGGYLPGVFVGYVTNIINSTADITNLYYAGISVLISLSASFMAKKGFFDKLWKAVFAIPVLAFFGGVVGSVLTVFIYGPGENTILMQIAADFKLDLLDKAITVAAFLVIYRFIPEKTRHFIGLTDWRQRPMSDEELSQSRKTGTKGLAMRQKITIMIGVIMAFVTIVVTAISSFLFKDFAIEQYTTVGKNVAHMAAIAIDGDRVSDYLERGVAAEGYSETKKVLYEIRDSAKNIEYVYVYRILPDGCHVVFDLDTEELVGEQPGVVVPFDESFMELLPALLAGEDVKPIITDDTYGWLLTDYEPVYDSEGNCVCYACADINMEDVRLAGVSFLAKILSLFSGFFVLILVLCIWFADYHLTYPIDAMTFAAGEFAYNDDESLDLGLKRLEELDIVTADELENLYHVLVKTIGESVGYIDEVRTKGEQIEQMQSDLIYILADLVESRDKNTGDHVKKTAAYVKLILDLMGENDIYADRLTPEFIKDVCNSAPLHDVGKIKVPDAILNKPGRLTDEEFVEMKKHTTAGKEVIENAMKLSGDTGYLAEALNLATHHHERWDGKGYPDGLKGEEIPLSARIMAVSDVFDALVSARSYKKPFTFEKAMDIIREGVGTQFDPAIAQVFIDNPDRVREIAEEHERRLADGESPVA